jgi:hypothetical protein
MSLYTKDLGTIGKFKIVFDALPEDTPIQGQFALDTEEETLTAEREVISGIESGKLAYFCAKVTAYFHALPLCETYLGCCIYESYESFLSTEKNGCISGMINEVIAGAKQRLKIIVETGKDLI